MTNSVVEEEMDAVLDERALSDGAKRADCVAVFGAALALIAVAAAAFVWLVQP